MHWRKRRSEEPDVPAATAGQTEADKALDKAEAGLAEVKRDEREIMAVAERLKRMGEQNDFAARIKQAMGGA